MPTPRLPQFTAWSHSRLNHWTQCPYYARLRYLDKLPEPPSAVMDEGARVHALCYQYLLGRIELPPELERFREEFIALKAAGAVVEREWAFDAAWRQVGWFDKAAACRVKVDAVAWAPPVAKVIDFKTGRPRPEDMVQLDLYALGALLRSEKVEKVVTSCWYLTHGQESGTRVYGRADLPALRDRFEKQAAPMLADTTFPATPGRHCRFCAYAADTGGPCEFDREGQSTTKEATA